MQRRIWPSCVLLILLLIWPQMLLAEDNGATAESDEDVVAEYEEDEGAVQDEDGEERAAAVEELREDGEPVIGPGGRPLRTDYPGTEESLQPRMDTSQVAGVERSSLEYSEEVYDLRVRELETQIDDLKERVFRSKSRIILLKETVLAENLAGSRAIVTFENDLGAAYEVYRAIFSVDGSRVFSAVDSEDLRRRQPIRIYNSPMTPGTHTVSVSLGLRGSGFGVFSYARGYDFSLRFSCQFTAEEGRTTLVTVRTFKSGNVFTAHEDRPDGICHVSMVELSLDDLDDNELPELD